MDDTRINIILDNCKGIRRDRALRIELGQLKESDNEFKQYIKNELVRARRICIAYYKFIETSCQLREVYRGEYRHFERVNEPVKRAETYLKIVEINNNIDKKLKSITTMGELFISVLSFDILDSHDICQLFNINWKMFKDKSQEYIKMFGKESHLTYKLISVMGVEYIDKKGRAKEFYDCPKSEMPVYWAMNECLMHKMEGDKEFCKAADEKFKELVPDVKKYRIINDLEGNIIGMFEEGN